jgi:hypothetical protein
LPSETLGCRFVQALLLKSVSPGSLFAAFHLDAAFFKSLNFSTF